MTDTYIKKAIRIKEACEIYSTSSSTIYRLINSGELHANKVGSATYLSVDELNELFLGEVQKQTIDNIANV